MLSKVHAAALRGVEASPVEVEVHVGPGEERIIVVGLPDAAVRESVDRVSTALTSSGYHLPPGKTTINLAPADLRKEGPSFDLAIALAWLMASDQASTERAELYALVGELALTGQLRRVKGVLPIALAARAEGRRGLLVPADNAPEAAVVEGLEVIPVKTLCDAVEFLAGTSPLLPVRVDTQSFFFKGSSQRRRFAGGEGAGNGEAGLGDCRGRRPQPDLDWPTRHGQEYAGQAVGRHPSTAYLE